jgi:CheY-like chemotaxis protein
MTEEKTARDVHALLVWRDDEVDAGRPLARELEAGGVEVRLISDPFEAVRRSWSGDVEVVVLAVPLPGVDPVAVCAALKEGPAPPVVILVDTSGDGARLEAALPDSVRPDAVLDGSADSAKLAAEIERMVGATSGVGRESASRGPAFAEILVELASDKETGVLEIHAEDVRTNVTFHRGRPVFAEGGGLVQTLGRLLLRRGEIHEDQYVRVIERMTERVIRNESVRMGEVLVELGILTPAEVYEALERQIRERIVACFQWESFQFEYRPQVEVSSEVASFRPPAVEALLLEGIKGFYDSERVRPILQPHAERYPALTSSLGELARSFQMTPHEQKLLHTITGAKPLAALRRDAPLDGLHAGQVLAALVLARKLELRTTPAHVRPAARPQSTPVPAPPREPVATARRPVVARGTKPSSEQTARAPRTAEATRSAERARRSLDSLRKQRGSLERSQESIRDPRQAELEAENACRKGRRLLQQNLLQGASKELCRAVELQPEQAEYQLWQAWVEYVGARGDEARTLAKAKTRAIAQKLLKQDRNAAKPHSVLGSFLYDEGELEAAERHFQSALRSDANDHDAQRGTRLIEARRRRRS